VRRWLTIALVVSSAAAVAGVQGTRSRDRVAADPAYDGRITFVRLRWGSSGGFSRRGGFGAAWNHDYPRAEHHLSLILKELTSLDIRTDASLVLSLDDPELAKYPVSFMWEPRFWNLTESTPRAKRTSSASTT
jgi:hypothetical protein